MHQPEEFIMGNAETRFSKNWLRATMMGVSCVDVAMLRYVPIPRDLSDFCMYAGCCSSRS